MVLVPSIKRPINLVRDIVIMKLSSFFVAVNLAAVTVITVNLPIIRLFLSSNSGDDWGQSWGTEMPLGVHKKAATTTTCHRSLAAPILAASGWSSASSLPIQFFESSCVWHAHEFWCVGGYMNAKVASYSPQTNQWTMRPSLLAVTHHIFCSCFSIMNGTRLMILGGLNLEGDNIGARLYNVQMLETTNPNSTWYEASEELGVADLDLRGMTHCTSIPIENEFYCVFGSDPHYVVDTSRFYAFNEATMQFRALPVPPEGLSHVALIADPIRRRVIYGMGRRTNQGGVSENLHFFDIPTETWNVVDPIQKLPDFMPRLEARGFYQHSSENYYGYVFGGQDQHRNHVSDVVHKFSLSHDPTRREIVFEHWSRLPLQTLFGLGAAEVQPGSGQIMVVGGSTSVGPHGSNKAWLWDQSHVPLTALELQRRDHNSGDKDGDHDAMVPAPQLSVVSAVYGTLDVTLAVQTLLDENWTEFLYGAMPDLGILEEWQWQDGSWPRYIPKKRNGGKVYRVGLARQQLTVTLQEPNGHFRVVTCPVGGGCKFSWWHDKEEREYIYQQNVTHEKTLHEHMASF